MNTDKTLIKKFASHTKYPIWYYKELEEVSIHYVIFNLLKESFVVELDNKKITMTFGKNENHEIGCSQSCNHGLDYTSYETINKAFKDGTWFRILETETSDEFKENYILEEERKSKIAERELKIDILTNALESMKNKNNLYNENYKDMLNSMSDEDLDILTDRLFKNITK